MAADLHGLKVDAQREGDVALVRLRGDVRSDQIHLFTAAVEDLAEQGMKHLLVDLAGMTFVDSASIGVVVRMNAELEKRGGRMIVHSVPRVARKVLTITGLDARVTLAQDEADARRRLAAP